MDAATVGQVYVVQGRSCSLALESGKVQQGPARQRPREGGQGLTAVSVNRKFLDSIVHGIHDVESAATIQCDSVRTMETAGLRSFSTHHSKILARVCELLNAVVGRADPDPVLRVHTQRDGAAGTRLAGFVERRRPKSSRLTTWTAPETEEFAIGGELLDAIEPCVRGIDIAGTVEGHKLRPGKTASRRHITTE